MSVFFRWGIFGILGVAGLMYAYNASKQLAAKRTAGAALAEPQVEMRAPATADPAPAISTPPAHCEAELMVAQHALAARAEGQPLDRLLRIQEIAFQEPARRQRLEKVATYWFKIEGPDPLPEALRAGVINDCIRASPAP